MSIEREELIKTIDTLKEAITKILDAQEQLEADAEAARTSRRESEEKAWAAEEKVKDLSQELEAKKTEAEEATKKAQELEDKVSELQKKLDDIEANRDEEVKKLIDERDALKKEMDEITEQLTRVSELYRETAAEKDKLKEKVDVSDLLAIYITLIETVFGGKPHARVLYTLHNTGTAIPRKNIESSTGIMATAVIKAIHDLRNAGLVSYDEESQEVRLIKDIF